MARAGYTLITPSPVALTASTTTTVLFCVAPATGSGIDLQYFDVSFDGLTVGASVVYVEVCYLTAATNSTPGTHNTAVTIQQASGTRISATELAGAACTQEPTVQTTLRGFNLTPYNGIVMYDWSLGDSPDSVPSDGFAIRCTPGSGTSVNVRACMRYARL